MLEQFHKEIAQAQAQFICAVKRRSGRNSKEGRGILSKTKCSKETTMADGGVTIIDKLFFLAYAGTLPHGFDRWEWKDKRGWTVAHEAARGGHLPPGFDRWDWTDEEGRTVAHLAAEEGRLPLDFTRGA
jgi:hypothetical protein